MSSLPHCRFSFPKQSPIAERGIFENQRLASRPLPCSWASLKHEARGRAGQPQFALTQVLQKLCLNIIGFSYEDPFLGVDARYGRGIMPDRAVIERMWNALFKWHGWCSPFSLPAPTVLRGNADLSLVAGEPDREAHSIHGQSIRHVRWPRLLCASPQESR